MKVIHQQLPREPSQSFIFYEETLPFPIYHNHPEFELAYIIEGRGKLMVGDYVGCFRENDLVFLGAYLPHEHRCDPQYTRPSGEFSGHALVVQFDLNSLGDNFILAPENRKLCHFLDLASRGCLLMGRDKHHIIDLMLDMKEVSHSKRLYMLMEIFGIFSNINGYTLLSSPGFVEPYRKEGWGNIGYAVEYIIQNFNQDIRVSDLLKLTSMSNTRFSSEFRNVTRMSFKAYLNNVRIGYVCRLLSFGEIIVSEAAFQAGFENVSNFNRQFKRIKGCTPKEYIKGSMIKEHNQNSFLH